MNKVKNSRMTYLITIIFWGHFGGISGALIFIVNFIPPHPQKEKPLSARAPRD
jgi:hypothetical protein